MTTDLVDMIREKEGVLQNLKKENTKAKEQTCIDCKHCNQCYKQRHQGSNKACDDIELAEWEGVNYV